eukprot:TRINITY_DN10372_c0_g1_i2.p2 TRINITY_DN10372_c0_g1~~TRINITY_DN10372_c0_g1_i2.p2  ORF type:complete len:127 (-),score=18.70 TRINITY_DN10372_c0_g1_i2:689-1069(-)
MPFSGSRALILGGLNSERETWTGGKPGKALNLKSASTDNWNEIKLFLSPFFSMCACAWKNWPASLFPTFSSFPLSIPFLLASPLVSASHWRVLASPPLSPSAVLPFPPSSNFQPGPPPFGPILHSP